MYWRQQRGPKQQATGRHSKHVVGAWAAVALVVLGLRSSEQPLAQKLRFEVASIRQGERTRQEGAGSPVLKVLPDRVEITNTPLRTLVRLAFDTKDYTSAWPDSLNPRIDERLFDVRATLSPGTTRDQVPAMLQALLQERFGLVSHIETRNVAVYELVVPSGGHRLREVEAIDEMARAFPTDGPLSRRVIADNTATPVLTESIRADNPQRIVAALDGIHVLTPRTYYVTDSNNGITKLVATRMTIDELIGTLSSRADRPVLDKTGLRGLYQFTMELPPMTSTLRVMANAGITTNRNGEPLDNGPVAVSVHRAVESVGLKLEARRAPVEVMVITSIQQAPTEN